MSNTLQPITIEQLPSVVANQVNSLADLSKQVQRCLDEAALARMSADEAASKTAGTSWRSFVPFVKGNNTIAIESLQDAIRRMGQAQVSTADAVYLIFENQQKLSAVAQYLVSLGVVSIAHNRTIVRQLELRLRNAPESEINELGKQEINNVIMQLKSQENLQDKVDEKVEQINSLQKQVSTLLAQVKTQKKTFWDSAGFKLFLLIMVTLWIVVVIVSNLPAILNH